MLTNTTQAFRRIIWAVIVEDKQGLGEETVFDFKHIPALSKTTKAEKARSTSAVRNGTERRNLRAFLFGCFFLLAMTFIGLRCALVAWKGCAILWHFYAKTSLDTGPSTNR